MPAYLKVINKQLFFFTKCHTLFIYKAVQCIIKSADKAAPNSIKAAMSDIKKEATFSSH